MVNLPQTPNNDMPAIATRQTFLPFYKPWIDDRDIDEVVDTLRSGWLGMGPKTLRFEEEFARSLGVRHAVAVSSCTAGLELALDAIGIQPGDEVITSVYTFPSTAAVILHRHGRPVLVDIRPDTLTMDPAEVERKITERTRALVPVHLAGAPCAMDQLLELAGRHHLVVIEDAAYALRAQYKGRLVGTLGDLTVFSFAPTEAITTGEGGMITTEHDDYADRLRTRRLHGMGENVWQRYAPEGAWDYEVSYPGYKSHMTDLNAALGLQQLQKAEMLHAVRSYYAGLYHLGLSDLAELVLPEPSPECQHSWQFYIVQLRLERLAIGRDTFIEALLHENIGASVHYIPLHLHPYYRDTFGYQPEDFPNALQAYRRVISLPIYPKMTEADVWDVIGAVRRVVERHRVR